MNLDRDIAISMFQLLWLYLYIYSHFNIRAIEIFQENRLAFEMFLKIVSSGLSLS